MSRVPMPNADASVHESDEEHSASGSQNQSQDDFDFDRTGKKPMETQKVKDKHYDEAVELSDDADESVASPHDSPRQPKGAMPPRPSGRPGGNDGSDSESEEDGDGDGGAEGGARNGARLYNPAEFAHLAVSPEIQDLFDYIGRYKPTDIELETKLRPFIPDYIPSIGEIDAFIKVPLPAYDEKLAAANEKEKKEELGLTVLDEPAAHQSDPTVLDLQLRVVSKQANMKPVAVRSIESAEKNPKKITKWIQSIEDIHRQKPPPTVNYSKEMPDIESLMQAWPTEFEAILKSAELPSPHLDLETAEFARMVCALLDIPVFDKITESLHVLFTLFAEFKSNAHFQQM